MDIINVIVTDTNNGSVISIESFPIYDENLRRSKVAKAEKRFCDKLPSSWSEFDYEVALDDGSVEVEDECALVSIIWTND
jgi:hypothetical protein